MCPNEAWELLTRGMEIRTASPEVLQFIFQKRRKITVRHGELRVTFGGQAYHYRMFDSSIQLVALHGRELEISFDPLDLETIGVYFESRFIGLAANAALRKMGENSFVDDEKDRRRVRREVKRYIQAVHQGIPIATPEERAARRMAVRPKPVASELCGTEITVPAEIRAAVEAAAENRQFSFAAASGADLIRLADARAYQNDDPDDGEFKFFQGAQ